MLRSEGVVCSRTLAIVVVAGLASVSNLPAQETPAAGSREVRTLSQAELYERLLASAVWIVRGEEEADFSTYYGGTGWLLDLPNRLVVTNYHVLSRGDETQLLPDDWFRVYFPRREGGRLETDKTAYLNSDRFVRARIVDADPERDLGILQLDRVPPGTEPLPLTARPIRPGEPIHLIGNPSGSGAMWVYTSGTVRQVYDVEPGGDAPAIGSKYRRVESQLPTNPGDSGGPVLNDRGEVVAIHHAHSGQEGVRLMARHIDASDLKDFMASVRPLLSPRTAADYVARGQRSLERGRWDTATEDFTAAIERDTALAAAYLGRGQAFYEKGDHETAIRDLDEALERKSDDPCTCYNLRGLCRDALGQLDASIEDFTQAIRARPGDAVLYANRGDTYRKDEQYERAIADYDEAIRLDPDNPAHYAGRGLARHDEEEYEAAVADYELALKRARSDQIPPILDGLGRTFYDDDKLDRAYAAFGMLEQLAPDYAEERKKEQDRKYLEINNATAIPLTVFVKYHTRTSEGEWKWFPSAPDEEGWARYTFAPGERDYLDDDGFLINADRVRIYAVSADGEQGVTQYRDEDLVLVPDGPYRALCMGAAVYTIGGE